MMPRSGLKVAAAANVMMPRSSHKVAAAANDAALKVAAAANDAARSRWQQQRVMPHSRRWQQQWRRAQDGNGSNNAALKMAAAAEAPRSRWQQQLEVLRP